MTALFFPFKSRNGFMEARIICESADDVTFFFRRIGTDGRGVAKAMAKDGFERTYRLEDPTPDTRPAQGRVG